MDVDRKVGYYSVSADRDRHHRARNVHQSPPVTDGSSPKAGPLPDGVRVGFGDDEQALPAPKHSLPLYQVKVALLVVIIVACVSGLSLSRFRVPIQAYSELLVWVQKILLRRFNLHIAAAADRLSLFKVAVACAMLALTGFEYYLLSERWENYQASRLLAQAQVGYLPTLEERASFASRLITFKWLNPLLRQGARKSLEDADVWALRRDDQAQEAWCKFRRHHGQSPSSSPLLLIVKTLRSLLFAQTLCGLIAAGLSFHGPIFVRLIVGFIEHRPAQSSVQYGYALVLGLFLCKNLHVVFVTRASFCGMRSALRARAILVSEIYLKVLSRKTSGGVGKVQILIDTDVIRVGNFIWTAHEVLAAPIELSIALAALYFVLGWSAFVGLGVLVTLIPFEFVFYLFYIKRYKALLKMKDRRISRITEMLQAIRMIKFNAWESKFHDDVSNLRTKELRLLRSTLVMQALDATLFATTLTIVSITAFVSFTKLQHETLDATTCFTAIALLREVKRPILELAQVLVQGVDSLVSYNRVLSFLEESPGLDCFREDPLADVILCNIHGAPIKPKPTTSHLEGTIEVQNATFSWEAAGSEDANATTRSEAFMLKDLNVKFPPRKLSVIIGLTGSGKTSALRALLGEMSLLSGSCTMPRHEIAYAPQQAWIQNATIRDNILFGSPFDSEKYNKTIDACGLARDLEILPHGDATQVGDRGVVLSGGQRQRLQLARAVYSGCATVLLDDVLSALDSPTARHVVDNVLHGVLAGRTRILVTHAVSLVAAQADFIVVLRGGQVVAQGNRAAVLMQLEGSSAEANLFREIEAEEDEDTCNADQPAANGEINARVGTGDINGVERKQNGGVRWSVYLLYFKASGALPVWSLLLGLGSAAHLAGILGDNWLRQWARQYSKSIGGAGTQDDASTYDLDYFLTVYGLIGLCAATLIMAQLCGQCYATLRGSRLLHSGILASVLAAPVSWFDTQPVGRMVNRFSSDVNAIDTQVAGSVSRTAGILLAMILEIGTIAVFVPHFLAVVPILLFLYWRIAEYFLRATRELKRIQAIHRSSVYSAFQETLAGASCVRAFCAEMLFVRGTWRLVDNLARLQVPLSAANAWLSVRMGLADSLVLLATGLAIMYLLDRLDGGHAGFCLNTALAFSTSGKLLVHYWAALELNLNAVERVGEYMQLPSEDRPPEEARHLKVARAQVTPPSTWPSLGSIVFRDVSCRYRQELPMVLKSISFSISPGERVALVGHSGAGKSTVLMALTRIIECGSGSISIDGIDVSTVGLKELRSRITVIPQDPALFEGTIRSNLDIFGVFSDDALWRSLNLVQCGPARLSLDDTITEHGANLACGQRQLLALARALLCQSRIVVLDEATASIDSESDVKIQKVLRGAPELKSATIICIAHRVRTIIDFDTVIVVDQGRVAQIGRPYQLLQDVSGTFYHMCQRTGELANLLEAAASSSKNCAEVTGSGI